MTDVIKPFKILALHEELDGRVGVEFQAEKIEIPEPYKRRRFGVKSYISIAAGEDPEAAVFKHLQDSGWL